MNTAPEQTDNIVHKKVSTHSSLPMMYWFRPERSPLVGYLTLCHTIRLLMTLRMEAYDKVLKQMLYVHLNHPSIKKRNALSKPGKETN